MRSAAVASEWDVFLLAGIGSTLAIFDDCKLELTRRFGLEGRTPRIFELFPYGDHTQKLMSQVVDVGCDVLRLRRSGRSGGGRAAEEIRRLSDGRRVLLIGHSGGGVAAYKAAVILYRQGNVPDCRVVMVGSPRVPIGRDFRDKVSYFEAVDEHGTPVDPITRLGSWGGVSFSRFGLPYWNRRKYAPGHIGTITVLGGHPHYFRARAPYVHPERGSNLSLTLDSIWARVADEAEEMT